MSEEMQVSLVTSTDSEAARLVTEAEDAFVAQLEAEEGLSASAARRRTRHLCARELGRLAADGAGGFLTVREGPETVGGIWYATRDTPIRKCWHILFITIEARHRGRGIGRRALKAFIERAKMGGASAITLSVSRDNAIARDLYSKAGFRPYADGMIYRLADVI